MTAPRLSLKWLGTTVQVVGVFVMSGRLGPTSLAFAVMLAGSVTWTVAAARDREWSALALNLAFTVSNVLGICRWLGA